MPPLGCAPFRARRPRDSAAVSPKKFGRARLDLGRLGVDRGRGGADRIDGVVRAHARVLSCGLPTRRRTTEQEAPWHQQTAAAAAEVPPVRGIPTATPRRLCGEQEQPRAHKHHIARRSIESINFAGMIGTTGAPRHPVVSHTHVAGRFDDAGLLMLLVTNQHTRRMR